MKSNRYLRLAQHHFLRAFAAFSFALAFATWACVAAMHESPRWCIASAMAAVFCAVATWIEAYEAHRCFEISQRFDRWNRNQSHRI